MSETTIRERCGTSGLVCTAILPEQDWPKRLRNRKRKPRVVGVCYVCHQALVLDEWGRYPAHMRERKVVVR